MGLLGLKIIYHVESEVISLGQVSYKPLLDLEKYRRLYMLHDLKRLNWGYTGVLRLAGLSFKVFVRVSSDELEIVEENGRFYSSISFRRGKGNLQVRINVESPNSVLKESLLNTLTRNIREYGSLICSKGRVESFPLGLIASMLKPEVKKVVDVRGEVCPVPEMIAKRELMKIKPGEMLELLVDHPAAVEVTLPEVAKLFNSKYEIFNMGDYVSFVMLKLGDPSTHWQFAEALEERRGIEELMGDGAFLAYLYTVFDRVVRREKVEALSPSILRGEGLTMIAAASIGRGWHLTALVEDENVLGVTLNDQGVRSVNREALNRLSSIKGLGHTFYLRPSIPL